MQVLVIFTLMGIVLTFALKKKCCPLEYGILGGKKASKD